MKKSIINKNKQPSQSLKNITIQFGYGLFALTVANVILSTVIPWTKIINTPHVMMLNAWVFMIALIAGTLLPVLISYILGDRATHVKNKASHHFNGILFGVAAYWLTVLFSMIGSSVISWVREQLPNVVASAVANAWPIVATTIIMAFVAVTYARHQKNKTSVLEHKPYQIVLVGTVLLNYAYMLINQIVTDPINLPIFLVYSLALVILFAISYLALRKSQLPRPTRLLLSLTALTILFVALTQASQFVFNIFVSGSFIWPMIAAFSFGLIVWVAYLVLISRKG